MEKPFDGLCDQSTNINRLEERQLQLHSSHRQSTHQDRLLQTSQDHL